MTKAELRRRVLAAITAAPGGLTRKELYGVLLPNRNLIKSLYIDLELDGLFAAGTVDKATRPARGARKKAEVFLLARTAETAVDVVAETPVAVVPRPEPVVVSTPEPEPEPVVPVRVEASRDTSLSSLSTVTLARLYEKTRCGPRDAHAIAIEAAFGWRVRTEKIVEASGCRYVWSRIEGSLLRTPLSRRASAQKPQATKQEIHPPTAGMVGPRSGPGRRRFG